ncbi:MAG: hypothetical protein HY879_12980 [Deltaproteobacteria bacterium]|nr:hypothetical protein [Deltaproteobacteria bacterium]
MTGILMVFGITYWQASTNFSEGERYLKEKEYAKAVLAFEQTLLNYYPGSSYQERAVKSLFLIGGSASGQQNVPLALQAYQSVIFAKTSLLVYRNLSQEDAQRALEKIKKINPKWTGSTIPEIFPTRFWSLILGVALLFWIISIFILIRIGFDQTGKIRIPYAFYPLGSFVVGVFVWVLALLKL